MTAAAAPPTPLGDAIPLHTVHYAASSSPIKDDIAQLAACWVSRLCVCCGRLAAGQRSSRQLPCALLLPQKTGSGALTKQEAGLLLTYHSQRHEDGCAEVLGAGVVAVCLEALDSSTALAADRSTAAGAADGAVTHSALTHDVNGYSFLRFCHCGYCCHRAAAVPVC